MAEEIIDSIQLNGTTWDFTLPSDADIVVGTLDAPTLYEGGVALNQLYASIEHAHEFAYTTGIQNGSYTSIWTYNTLTYNGFSGNIPSFHYLYTFGNQSSSTTYPYDYSFPADDTIIGREPMLKISGSSLTNVTIHLVRFDGTELVLSGSSVTGTFYGISYFYFTRSGTSKPYTSFYYVNKGVYDDDTELWGGIIGCTNYNVTYTKFMNRISTEFTGNTTTARMKEYRFYLTGDVSIYITGA